MKDLNIIEYSNGYYVELEDETIIEASSDKELLILLENRKELDG